MKTCFIAMALLVAIVCDGQIMTTVAGGGASIADGIPATNAQIGYTGGVTVDDSGNIYIANGFEHNIRKVDASSGLIYTIAGNGIGGFNGDNQLATSAQVNAPLWIMLDKHRNIFFTDNGNFRIRKINVITGIISTVVGTGIQGFSGDGHHADSAMIYGAQSIAFDSFGNFYFSDNGNYRIRKVDSFGIITTVAGNGTPANLGNGGLAVNSSVHWVLGVCTDPLGNVYFQDDSATIRKIDINSGLIFKIAGTSKLGTPYLGDGILADSSRISAMGIACDNAGNLYVADYGNN